MNADVPTLTDLSATDAFGYSLGQIGERGLTAVIVAVPRGTAAFTIQCDRCGGLGTIDSTDADIERSGWTNFAEDCPSCAGAKVLPVGVLRAPVDEEALRGSLQRALDDATWDCARRAARQVAVVMAVLREAGVLPKAADQ